MGLELAENILRLAPGVGADADHRPDRAGRRQEFAPALHQASSGSVNVPNGGHAKTGRFPLALRGDAQFVKLTVPRAR